MNKNIENKDIYYFGFQMMLNALKTDNIQEGLNGSLEILRTYAKSNDVIVYKLDDNNQYNSVFHTNSVNDNTKYVTIVLNEIKEIVEQDKYRKIDFSLNESLLNVVFMPVVFKNFKYMICLTNSKIDFDKVNSEIVDIIHDIMFVILEKLELYDILNRNSVIDVLTGLKNQNAYLKKRQEIDSIKNKCVFAIFDLFRLKYVNDNYGHLVGDKYIVKTAELLKKYFPRYVYLNNQNSYYEKGSLGTCVYRIGGDEFVMITNIETREQVEEKIKLLVAEVKNIDLGVEEELPLGLNYGVASREDYESSKELYEEADEHLRNHKAHMYKVLGIERRR